MTRSRTTALVVLAIAMLTLSACAAGPNNVAHINAPHIAGFWLGLWQGMISPFTFIISLFNHNVNIYEVHNNGNWYNFGFVLGAGILFGGGTSANSR